MSQFTVEEINQVGNKFRTGVYVEMESVSLGLLGDAGSGLGPFSALEFVPFTWNKTSLGRWMVWNTQAPQSPAFHN